MTGIQISTAQQSLSVGDNAPEFSATADDGSVWDLKDHLGKNYLVVYFYPGAMTSGCTKQACSYRDRRNDLQSSDVTVVGISGDKVENLRLFRKAENLNFTLLSDDKGEIARAFGVPTGAGGSFTKVVDGNEYQVSRDLSEKRWTFVLDKNGRIIYKNDAVNAEKDAEEVLDFIRNQSKG
ncbi:MAG TPA: peroxiredoxin, partial [Bacteroidales bacterium]|nr:peroxiredoxin [Bacteroidales bacterium]